MSIFEFAYISKELQVPNKKIYEWDWLLISGIPTFILALWQAQGVGKRFETALTRSFRQEILQIKLDNLNSNETKKIDIFERFLGVIKRKSIKFSLFTSVFIALIIFSSFAFSYLRPPWEQTVPLTVLETFLALIAGWHLGQILFNGILLGRVQKQNKSCFKVQFEHPDKMGGLKILTDFYSYQARVAAYPVIYLAVWVLIFQGCDLFKEYINICQTETISFYIKNWRIPYIALLLIATAIEFMAFFIPLLFLHRILERESERQELLKKADGIASDYKKIKGEIEKTKSYAEYNELNHKLSILETEYWSLNKMSTWPISTKNFLGFIQRYFLPGITSIIVFIETITKIYQTISNSN